MAPPAISPTRAYKYPATPGQPVPHLHGKHEGEGDKARKERHPDEGQAEVQDHERLEWAQPQEVAEQAAKLEPLDIRRRQVDDGPGRCLGGREGGREGPGGGSEEAITGMIGLRPSG